MNKLKKQNIQRQRNIQLSTELEELKTKTQIDNMLNNQDKAYVKQLIVELEEIRTELKSSLAVVNEKRLEYEKLIQDLKSFKKEIYKRKK